MPLNKENKPKNMSWIFFFYLISNPPWPKIEMSQIYVSLFSRPKPHSHTQVKIYLNFILKMEMCNQNMATM